MTPDPKAASGLGLAAGSPAAILSTPRARALPQVVWVALVFAPVLGWCSTVCMLGASLRTLSRASLRTVCTQVLRGPARWIAVIALAWWLTLLAGDLFAASPTAWWQDLRFLLVILPALALTPVFLQSGVTHRQVGRWATWSVWVAVTVTSLEYLIAVHGFGVIHHRPRALSGNALFVSTMLVPMMLLAWLGVGQGRARPWLVPLATHLAGIACLNAVLGARAATVAAIVLLPMPMIWFRREFDWSARASGLSFLTLAALCTLLILTATTLSGWYEERWGALWGVVAGADAATLADYGIATRALHWPAAWQAFLERPMLGYGFLNEMAVLRRHLAEGSPVLPTAHQQYLSFLLWSGLPGLITGSALIGLPILLALTAARSARGLYAGCALGLPMLLNGLTDTVFDDLRIVSFHLMMTLLLASAHTASEDEGEPKIRTACV